MLPVFYLGRKKAHISISTTKQFHKQLISKQLMSHYSHTTCMCTQTNSITIEPHLPIPFLKSEKIKTSIVIPVLMFH